MAGPLVHGGGRRLHLTARRSGRLCLRLCLHLGLCQLHLLGLERLLLFQLLLQVCPGVCRSGIVQQLQLCPERHQSLRPGGISKAPGGKQADGLLPHPLPVVGQSRRGVGGEKKLVVPVPVPVGVLLQEVVPVEGVVGPVALAVLAHHGPGLVGVGQAELEDQAEQVRVGGVLHGPLALQPAGGLCRRELLGHAALGAGILLALEAPGDADGLPGLLVDLGKIGHLVFQIACKVDVLYQCRVGDVVEEPDRLVLLVDLVPGGGWHDDPGPRFDQPVDDLLFQAVGGVLGVLNFVYIAVPQQLTENGDVALEHQGID